MKRIIFTTVLLLALSFSVFAVGTTFVIHSSIYGLNSDMSIDDRNNNGTEDDYLEYEVYYAYPGVAIRWSASEDATYSSFENNDILPVSPDTASSVYIGVFCQTSNAKSVNFKVDSDPLVKISIQTDGFFRYDYDANTGKATTKDEQAGLANEIFVSKGYDACVDFWSFDNKTMNVFFPAGLTESGTKMGSFVLSWLSVELESGFYMADVTVTVAAN